MCSGGQEGLRLSASDRGLWAAGARERRRELNSGVTNRDMNPRRKVGIVLGD